MITLASIAGSPGATRLAIGLAASWPSGARRVVVEADDAGGRLGAELGMGVEPGLMALALAVRTTALSSDEIVERGAGRAADWYVIPAPASGEQTCSALTHSAAALADAMAATDDVWIVDAGRLTTRSAALPFALASERVVLVTAGGFADLQVVPHRVDALARVGAAPAIVVVEPTSWPPAEVAAFLGADVLAVLPRVTARDRRVAAMRAVGWRSWWRAVGDLAELLADSAVAAAPDRSAEPSERTTPAVSDISKWFDQPVTGGGPPPWP